MRYTVVNAPYQAAAPSPLDLDAHSAEPYHRRRVRGLLVHRERGPDMVEGSGFQPPGVGSSRSGGKTLPAARDGDRWVCSKHRASALSRLSDQERWCVDYEHRVRIPSS
ncbi:hypothetical protein GCM10027517_11760 [Phycicoccus ginsengisoli]